MPELPEVEGFRQVADNAVGRRITRVRVLDPEMCGSANPRDFPKLLVGHEISRTFRRGKVLLIYNEQSGADAPVLIFRFGMTGRLWWGPEEPRPNDRLLILFDGDVLAFTDTRRLGSFHLVERSEVADELWMLGPEPADVAPSWFVDAISVRYRPIKTLLLDQSFLAGLGNIYADEALFDARIAPHRFASELSPTEARRLHTSIKRVLRIALKRPGMDETPALPLFRARRKAAKFRKGDGLVDVGCPRCHKPLRTLKIGGRTSYWCDACQL